MPVSLPGPSQTQALRYGLAAAGSPSQGTAQRKGDQGRRGGPASGKLSSCGHGQVPIPAALWHQASLLPAVAWLTGVPGGRGGRDTSHRPSQPGPQLCHPDLQNCQRHPCCRRHKSAREIWFDVAGLLLFLDAAEGAGEAPGKLLTRLRGSHTGSRNFSSGDI